MSMKKRMKRLTALFLSTAMAVSMLAGCGSKDEAKKDAGEKTEKQEEGKDSSSGGEVEITFWDKDALETGPQNTTIADAIAEKTGVRLNVMNGDAQ